MTNNQVHTVARPQQQCCFSDGRWSESLAVGTRSFVEKIKERLGIRALGRRVVKTSDLYELKEPVSSYGSVFDAKKEPLSSKNSFSWRILDSNSIT